jgi:hypothetical protein
MMCFIDAINESYEPEEMKTIMQTFEDGFGSLPLTTQHKKLLDYLPSEDQSTIPYAIM